MDLFLLRLFIQLNRVKFFFGRDQFAFSFHRLAIGLDIVPDLILVHDNIAVDQLHDTYKIKIYFVAVVIFEVMLALFPFRLRNSERFPSIVSEAIDYTFLAQSHLARFTVDHYSKLK